MKARRTEESGSLLLIALFLILGIGAMLAAAVNLSGVDTLETIEATQGGRALFLAESGLENAKYQLKNNLCTATGLTLPVTGQLAVGENFSVNVTSLGNNQFRLDATGTAKTAQRQMREVVSCTVQGMWSAGIIGCQGISLNGNVHIDSVDTSVSSVTLLGNGDIQTLNPAAPITLTGNVELHGDAKTTGSGSNLSLTGNSVVYANANVTGSISLQPNTQIQGTSSSGQTATTTAADCDPLGVTSYVSTHLASAVPVGTPAAYSWSGNGSFTAASTYYATSFSLGANRTMNMTGPGNFVIYVTGGGSLSIAGNAVLNVSGGAHLTVYMSGGGTFGIGGNGVLNLLNNSTLTLYTTGPVDVQGNGLANAGLPTNFRIYDSYSGAASLRLGGNAQLNGVIYAPLMPISMGGNPGVIGAVRGASISNNGNVEFNYDESLGLLSEGGKGVVAISSWQELF
ncbi:MAG: hypothetical protein HQL64_04250 [Magnetococcales bacterium]|nr:hypothetical protein [Magnetococcales bacterium]